MAVTTDVRVTQRKVPVDYRPMSTRRRRVTVREERGLYFVDVDGLCHSWHRDMDHARCVIQQLADLGDTSHHTNALLRKAVRNAP